MGSHCAKLCDSALPNFRRQSHGAPTHVGASSRPTSQAPASRVEALRGSTASVIFKEGFALGLQVRKLQRILEIVDADEPVVPEEVARADRVPDDHPPDLNLGSDEPAPPVHRVTQVPTEIPHDILHVCANLRPTHRSFDQQLEKDFKPWLQVLHGGSQRFPSSLL